MVDQHFTDRKGTLLILKEGGTEIVEPDCADRDSVPWTLEQKTCEPLAPSPRQSLSSDAVS